MKLIFEKIYDLHHWYHPESKSGPGASMHQTKAIRQCLLGFLDNFRIKSILDIPCGDFYWMKEIDLSGYDYFGADIVSDLIRQNETTFGHSRRKFFFADITNSKLPNVDLIFCRDCLVHLSFDDGKKALANIQKTESKYLLTTTFPGRLNKDTCTGNWRPIDLQSSPYSLQEPLYLFNENCTEGYGEYADKSLALWKIDHLYNTR